MYDFDKENTIVGTTRPGTEAPSTVCVNQNRTYEYKSPTERVLYESQIPTRIRPFLTIHKEALGKEIEATKQLTTSDYLALFKTAWENHASACDAIDDFLMNRTHSNYRQWSPLETEQVRTLFIDAYETDRDKNIVSGGVKEKIETSALEIQVNYGWDEAELETCLTPSHPTFHAKYNLDHMKFLIAKDRDDEKVIEEYLIKQYHHQSKDFFEARLARMPFYSMKSESIATIVQHAEEAIEKSAQKKRDFLEKYPEAEDIDSLIVFDNWQEYLYAYTQRAFPDLYLREEILDQAKLLGIEVNDEALSYNNQEILEILDRILNHTENTFSIPVKNYQQTTTSCGTSCVMSIAHHQIPHSRNNEYKLWRRVGAPYNFPGGLGVLLRELDFETIYTVNRENHFAPSGYPVYDFSTNAEAQEIVPQYTALHVQATEMGMETVINDTSFEDVVSSLKKGWLSIVGIHMPDNEHLLHWVVANGYTKKSDGSFLLEISDPLNYFRTMDESEYQSLTDTYMGRRVILVNKNQRSSL